MSDKSIRDRIADILMMRREAVASDPRIPSLTGAMYPPPLASQLSPIDPNIPPLTGAMYPPEPTDYEEFYGGKGRR